MNWNRKYRPKKIADLHLTKVREHFLALLTAGKFSQVFLFAGPKGTGKTSTARIIAAILNDPQNEQSVTDIFFKKSNKAGSLQEPDSASETIQRIFAGSSFMVQELDAASNRGIDDVRALKERVTLPPQDGLVSVYILDEVHMLTSEAFNALLKLLEEPPPHVVFILATTELEKIPPTVVSRAQVITFTKATNQELQTALSAILTQEKVNYEEEVLALIAERADGSFRDAVKLLEMLAQVGPITLATAEQVLAVSADQYPYQLVEALLHKNPAQVVALFETLRSHGTDHKQFYTQLVTALHTDLLKSHGVVAGTPQWPAKTSQFLLKEFADPFVQTITPIPLLTLELKFLEIIDRSQKKSTTEPPPSGGAQNTSSTTTSKTTEPRKTKPEQPIATINTPGQASSSLSINQPIVAEIVSTTADSRIHYNPGDGAIIYEKWVEIVATAVQQNFGLATLLRSARPISGEMGKVVVGVYYSFHKEQLLQPKFKQLLDVLFAQYAGGRIELECILADQPTHADLQEPPQATTLAQLAVASLM
jgi:DNA polymerase-3 subunit gamma/tau